MRILDSIDESLIAQLRGQGEFFWLDLVSPTADEIQRLGTLLGWHPLSIEDTQRMGQRPKLDVYGEGALLVLQGAVELHPEDENDHPLEEVHCHLSGEFIVTVHSERFQDLRQVRALLQNSTAPKTERYYVYKIIDVIVDSYFPILSDLDEEINGLEDAIVAGGGRKELQQTFGLKRLLLKLRRAVVPMRDLFARQRRSSRIWRGWRPTATTTSATSTTTSSGSRTRSTAITRWSRDAPTSTCRRSRTGRARRRSSSRSSPRSSCR